MNELTFEERNLICIYNSSDTRAGVIAALKEMRGYLESDDTELRDLTGSAINKLEAMTDTDYDALNLIPDFDPEDADGE